MTLVPGGLIYARFLSSESTSPAAILGEKGVQPFSATVTLGIPTIVNPDQITKVGGLRYNPFSLLSLQGIPWDF